MLALAYVLITSDTHAAFPYRQTVFDEFVKTSYHVADRVDWQEFYRVLDERSVAAGIGTWEDWIREHPAKPGDYAAREAGAEVWKRVKKTITKFSLDRGFEFRNVVATGERQCYLQSILVAGVLQRAGYDCGIAMVWANPKGQISNNGHAVAVVRSGKKDLVVDCSEPKPFEVHQGLFLKTEGTYRYVKPIYNKDEWITAYQDQKTGETVLPNTYQMLDLNFLRSQFDYYRGERVTGGIIASKKTKAGLAASELFFRKSLAASPFNPLTRSMLVLTLANEKKFDEAEKQRKLVLGQYAAYGWTPPAVLKPVVRS